MSQVKVPVPEAFTPAYREVTKEIARLSEMLTAIPARIEAIRKTSEVFSVGILSHAGFPPGEVKTISVEANGEGFVLAVEIAEKEVPDGVQQ